MGRRNRVIAATDEKQFAVPLRPDTLALDKAAGIRARPGHIHLALRELAGIADAPDEQTIPARHPRKGTPAGPVGLRARFKRLSIKITVAIFPRAA